MRNVKKMMAGCLLAAVFAVSMMRFDSFAANEDTANEEDINGVSVTVTSHIEAGDGSGELDVTVTNSRYSVSSFDFEGGESNWRPGDVPKVKAVLDAADGYVFSRKVNTGNVRVSGGTCAGVRRLDGGTSLELFIRLKPVKGRAGEVGEAYWSDSPLGTARWDKAENAEAYELRLYRGNSKIKSVEKTSSTSYNFHPYMTKSGDYTFWVRATSRNSSEGSYLEKGDWQVSGNLYIKPSEVADGSERADQGPAPDYNSTPGVGSWGQEQGGWRYTRADGTHPTNCWEQIDGKWYLLDMNGSMLTGWQQRDGKYYYMTTNGDMQTGWVQYNRTWYYMGSDGAMVTGWINPDGKYYYLKSDGSMMTGWFKYKDQWYYLDLTTGAMLTNTVVEQYDINADGVWVP